VNTGWKTFWPWFITTGTTGGIPGPFKPSDIADLALWLDASDVTTVVLDGSDNVSQWNDKSTNGRNVTQADTLKRPARISAGMNGLDVLRFDGTNDSLASSAFACTPAFTFFAVMKSNAATQAAFARFFEAGANNGWAITAVPNVFGVQYGDTSVTSRNPPLLSTSTFLVEFRCDGASPTRNLSFNTDQGTATTTTRATTPTTPVAFFLGRFGGGESNYGAFDCAELAYYARELTAGERTSVLTYLKNKWGTP
jgi:hypothetical protein